MQSHTDLAAIRATKLKTALCNVKYYKPLMGCRGSDAQSLLDAFQSFLSDAKLDAAFKGHVLVATQRLSGASGLFPVYFQLKGVTEINQEPMASGGFGDIYQGTFQGEAVCIKALRVYDTSDVEYIFKKLTKEAILWGQLLHPNILTFYGVYRFRGRPCLVAPWMSNGDITKYLKNNPDAPRLHLADDVANGLQYLHERGIVHGDLKGPNILVDDAGRARLADFGISSITNSEIIKCTTFSSAGSTGGSVRWQAPELFDSQTDEEVKNSTASDIYAWAGVCFEIFTGTVPFSHLTRDPAIMFQVQRATQNERPTITEVIHRLHVNDMQDERPSHKVLSPGTFQETMIEPLDQIAMDTLDRLLEDIMGADILPDSDPIQAFEHTLFDDRSTQVEAKLPDLGSIKDRRNDYVKLNYVRALVTRLGAVFNSAEQYEKLLSCDATHVQILLDTFQALLDVPHLSAKFRTSVLVAIQQFSRHRNAAPTCYVAEDVEIFGEFPLRYEGHTDVYKGGFRGQVVCLKVFKIYSKSEIEVLLKHGSAVALPLGQLSHINLLPFYGLYYYNQRLCTVSPWMTYGTVVEFLREHPDENRNSLVLDIGSGIAYLHEHDIVHGNLKGTNVHINDCRRACLADFGLSFISDSDVLRWGAPSTVAPAPSSVRWQAPELYNFEAEENVAHTKASDVYAFSCVTYQIFTGKVPFFQVEYEVAVMFHVKAGRKPLQPGATSLAWSSWGLTWETWLLMLECWSTDPNQRPNISDVVSQHSSTILMDDRPSNNGDVLLSPADFRNSVRGKIHLLSVEELEEIVTRADSE